MQYQTLTTILWNAAYLVIGQGTYTHAGRLDYSQSSIAEPFPHLNTFPPTDVTPDGAPAVRSYRILFHAVTKEPEGASMAEKTAIHSEMDLLIQRYMDAIDTNEMITVTGKRRETQVKSYGAGVSGYMAEFVITGHLMEDACPQVNPL